MGWREDIEALLARLPTRFTLAEIYRFVPLLQSKYPDNHHIEPKIRQVLQQLRDENRLVFISDGVYEQVSSNPIVLDLPLQRNQLLTRSDLAQMLGQAGDAALRRGMFKPASGPFVNHMFLFHNEVENPYGDVHEGTTIQYVGEGRVGNQELKRNNATLAAHLDQGIQVHYFVQPREHPGKIRYSGPVFVDEYDEVYRPSEGRSVWQFRLLPADARIPSPVQSYGEIMQEMVDYGREAGPVDRPLVQSISLRRIRDRAFRSYVLTAYRAKCAICGEVLRKGRIDELEAAHVQAVSANGPDELRNGIALCIRHHWTFDHGFFTLTDAHKIRWLAPTGDPHEEIVDGSTLELPMDAPHRPHSTYLAWHRQQWEGPVSELF